MGIAGHPVTRRDPSDRKSAKQLGGRRMAESTSSSEEGAKHPEGYRLIGKVPYLVHTRTTAARRAFDNLTLGDKQQAVTW